MCDLWAGATPIHIQVYNVKTGQWPESNMILLNGVPFYDMNYIATLGTKDISRIEVIAGNYLLGDLTLEGLVSIYTHDHKIPEAYLKNRSFIFQNTVVPSDKPATQHCYLQAGAGTSHDPDFRVNLLWDPVREITGDQKLVIRFPVSLITGTYDIVVNGLTHKGISIEWQNFIRSKITERHMKNLVFTHSLYSGILSGIFPGTCIRRL